MDEDYFITTQMYISGIVDQTGFVTRIYYNDLKTYIIVEIDTQYYDQEYLSSVMNFLSYNTQFYQLMAGVNTKDIQLKVIVIDNQSSMPIAELIYPQIGE